MVAAVAGLFFTAAHSIPRNAKNRRHLKGVFMRGLKILASTAALLVIVALAPPVHGQISINIGVQPTCSYGYYDYEPYACAPRGYYGSGYFYNGIFVGMGPWSGWGYQHGWGAHRFVSDGGGRYHEGIGRGAYRGNQGRGPSERGGNRSQHDNRGGQSNGRGDSHDDRGNHDHGGGDHK